MSKSLSDIVLAESYASYFVKFYEYVFQVFRTPCEYFQKTIKSLKANGSMEEHLTFIPTYFNIVCYIASQKII